MPRIVCLDLEGVLVPEVWIAFAEKTGIPELRRTTRDEPDYDVLMRGRIEILDRHGLRLPDIQEVIATMSNSRTNASMRSCQARGCIVRLPATLPSAAET